MVYVVYDVFDGVKCQIDIGYVMYGQYDVGQDLNDQYDGEYGVECVSVVQVVWYGIGNEVIIDYVWQWEMGIDLFFKIGCWFVRRMFIIYYQVFFC